MAAKKNKTSSRVVIGVDPHKRIDAVVVLDEHPVPDRVHGYGWLVPCSTPAPTRWPSSSASPPSASTSLPPAPTPRSRKDQRGRITRTLCGAIPDQEMRGHPDALRPPGDQPPARHEEHCILDGCPSIALISPGGSERWMRPYWGPRERKP